MSPPSTKDVIIHQLEQVWILSELTEEYEISSEEESNNDDLESDTSHGIDEFPEDDETSPAFLLLVCGTRYLAPRSGIPKSQHFLKDILPFLDGKRFRHELRVSKRVFASILREIEGHSVFAVKGGRPVIL